MPGVSRREFVHRAMVGLGAASVAPLACADPVAPTGSPGTLVRQGPPKRVVVAGAGLAGLVAAYELERAGHDVMILEARARVGGRVHTLRTPFADGQYAEAGAARIPALHELTLGYARHFGLELDRFYPPDGLYVQYAAGERVLTPHNVVGQSAMVRIRGGTDRLPLAFADRLRSRILLDSRVVRVDAAGAPARVTFLQRGSPRTTPADHVLCTIPFPVLDIVEFMPPLSSGKLRAVRELTYEPVTRVFVQFGRRFWEDEGCNGFAATDWPEEVWHPSWHQSGPRGILMSYMRGTRAVELAALPDADRVARIVEHWERVFPGAREHRESGLGVAWSTDPWAGGGYANPSAAQLAELGPHIASGEGPIHFAGEHASAWRGWMQGALSSGLRAAAEINAAQAVAAWVGGEPARKACPPSSPV